jgi:CRP/FNR family transcriptional regulator, cyclic AMP receptor protein
MKFIELLCNRLRRTSEQVEQLILLNLPGRLASALLGLTEKRRPDLDSRTVAVTQLELSEMVGMTRESINKQLRAWAACGWVQLKRGGIVVVDANSLRQLIEARSGSDE